MVALMWIAGGILRLVPESLVGRLLPGSLRFTTADIPGPPIAPSEPVRLYIGPVNWAGQATAWAKAAVRYLSGVGAVTMAYRTAKDFSFPVDNPVPLGVYAASRRWQRAQYRAVSEGFTHVIVEAERQPFGAILDRSARSQVERLERAGIAVAMLCHGSDIRLPSRHAAENPDSPFHGSILSTTAKLERDARRNRVLLDRLELPVFVSTPDLLIDVPAATWLPVVVDPPAWKSDTLPLERTIPVVAHAPSRGAMKGSDLIDPILRRLEYEGIVSYRRVEGVPFSEMGNVYRDADIVLDQFRLGDYGVAACEAMAAGRVVVAHVSTHSRDHVLSTTGLELPVIESRAENLADVIMGILADREHYREVAARGVEFVAEVHSGRRSAELLRPFLGAGDHRSVAR